MDSTYNGTYNNISNGKDKQYIDKKLGKKEFRES